jgi:hypothetical protein
MYGVNTTSPESQRALVSLNVLFSGMPTTSGCEKCVEANGENAFWCCKTQSPSMYYVEFLNVYNEVKKWPVAKQQALISRSIRNYLDDSVSKGCVFYVDGCLCYSQRPFICRSYGVIPQENWDKRWESLKDNMGDQFNALPQCNLVASSTPISAVMENRWFEHTKKCEGRLGVSSDSIRKHDEDGGSYRTFHDHLLLEMFGEELLVRLTKIKLSNPTKEEIKLFIEALNEKTIPS